MMKKLGNSLIMIALFMHLLVGTSHADPAKTHITMGIFPCTDAMMSLKKFNPLITYLRQYTGLDIRRVVPKDPEEFERAVRNGDIDFAFQDPHIYVKLADLYDKDALIISLTRKGATSQRGLVIARKGSGISKLEDLKGKVVVFGPKRSAARWVAAKVLFEENGIKIDKDLRAYSNGRCCEDVAFSVYLKAVDAGVVCDHFLEEHMKKQQELGVDPEQLTVICRTRLVPNRVLAAGKKIRTGIVARVNQALLELDVKKPEHAQILYRAEFGGFQKSKDEDFDNIRLLIGAKTRD